MKVKNLLMITSVQTKRRQTDTQMSKIKIITLLIQRMKMWRTEMMIGLIMDRLQVNC